MADAAPRAWHVPAVIAALACVWLVAGTGLVSSNDGSHLALARAFARGRVAIDDDVALTLWVDRAVVDGRQYSDRPPGTALAAVPATWIGGVLDPPLWQDAQRRRDTRVRPAGQRYAETYVVRSHRFGVGVPLAMLQGTVLAIAIHCALVGALGLWCLDRWLALHGMPHKGRVLAILAVGLATLFGPYSTVLFSHATSATAWCAMALCCTMAQREPMHARALHVAAGVLGGWAVASDYSMIVPIALHLALAMPWRAWPWAAAGALVPAVALAAYHHAAFGSWHSIGYDHHANFEFARARGSTFAGDPIEGLWVLLGLGRGAGVLAQAPLVLLGAVGLALGRRWREGVPVLAWVLVLAFHRTPWGGATMDHRYLVPAVPIVALGFATIWSRWIDREHRLRSATIVGTIVLATCSAALAWSNFFAMRDG